MLRLMTIQSREGYGVPRVIIGNLGINMAIVIPHDISNIL